MAIFGNFKGTTQSEFKIGKSIGNKISAGSRPDSDESIGDIYFDSANASLQVYNNAWVSIGETLTDLNVDDGTLFVDSSNDTVSIGSTSSNDKLFVNGSLRLGTNPSLKYSGAYLDVKHSNGSGTVIRIRDNDNGVDPIFKVYGANNESEVFRVQGSNVTIANAYVLPTTDGTLNQVLVTDGNGTLSFGTVASDLVNDTSPALGGNLDAQNYSITGVDTLSVANLSYTNLVSDYGSIDDSNVVVTDYGNISDAVGFLTAGTYGNTAYTPVVTVDSYGTITSITSQQIVAAANISSNTTDDLTEGSTNLYFTTDRANTAIDNRIEGGNGLTYSSGTLTVGAGAGITVNADNVALTGGIVSTGDKTYGTASAVPVITVDTYGRTTAVSNTTISVTSAQVSDFSTASRSNISVTDAGGDGSLSYDNSTGVITYTGPSQAEANSRIDARLSGGTGVTYTSGVISIGQAVGTTSDVTFNDLTVSGNLTVSGTTTTVNTETINLADNVILLNSNEAGTPSQNAGIEIERGTESNKTFVWDETADKWTVGSETLVAATFEGNLTGDASGNAGTATKLATARTIALSGDVTGSATFDGSANASVTTTIASGNLSNCTVDGTNTVGFRNIPQNSKSEAYTLVADDAGKHIFHPSADTTARTWTIPANSSVPFPIGTAITFINQNGAGTITIAITSDTMRLADAGTTGSRTLGANGVATAIKITATEWIISGVALT